MIKIEKNIPISKMKAGGRHPKYPFADMVVGDSFEVGGKSTRQFAGSVNSASKRCGFKFVTRTTESGVRVWRIE